MKKQFWNLENDKPLQDKNSEDGVKHYNQSEKDSFMQAVISKMEANGMSVEEAQRAYYDSDMDLDIIIPNYSAREVAKLLSGKENQPKQDDSQEEPAWFKKYQQQQDERFEKINSKLKGMNSLSEEAKAKEREKAEAVNDAEEWAKTLPDNENSSLSNGDFSDAEEWAKTLPDKEQ